MRPRLVGLACALGIHAGGHHLDHVFQPTALAWTAIRLAATLPAELGDLAHGIRWGLRLVVALPLFSVLETVEGGQFELGGFAWSHILANRGLLGKWSKRAGRRFVAIGMGMQFGLAIVLLRFPLVTRLLGPFNRLVELLQGASDHAAQYLFGYLSGSSTPFQLVNPESNFLIAFRIFPLIIVVSALSSLLFHIGLLPLVIRALSRLLSRALGLSGVLAFGAASTVFLGTIEAPLTIRPYLSRIRREDLFALLCCSMATVSGAVMVLYAGVLKDMVERPIEHLMIASLMSVPAALTLSHLVMPGRPEEAAEEASPTLERAQNAADALVRGAQEGMQVVLGVTSLLLTMFALVFLLNQLLLVIGFHGSLQSGLGQLLRPLLWLTGIPWNEAAYAGELMGTKIVLNEFVAYLELSKHPEQLSAGSRLIMTYNLCGFANFASLGIMLGGLTPLIPERRQELARLLWFSLIVGNLAVLMTGSVVAVVGGIS